jgi:hypothetical protein
MVSDLADAFDRAAAARVERANEAKKFQVESFRVLSAYLLAGAESIRNTVLAQITGEN